MLLFCVKLCADAVCWVVWMAVLEDGVRESCSAVSMVVSRSTREGREEERAGVVSSIAGGLRYVTLALESLALALAVALVLVLVLLVAFVLAVSAALALAFGFALVLGFA